MKIFLKYSKMSLIDIYQLIDSDNFSILVNKLTQFSMFENNLYIIYIGITIFFSSCLHFLNLSFSF